MKADLSCVSCVESYPDDKKPNSAARGNHTKASLSKRLDRAQATVRDK